MKRLFVAILFTVASITFVAPISADVVARTCSGSPILLYDILDGEMSVVGHISGNAQINLPLDVSGSYTDSDYHQWIRVSVVKDMSLSAGYEDLLLVFVERSAVVFAPECLPRILVLVSGAYVDCGVGGSTYEVCPKIYIISR